MAETVKSKIDNASEKGSIKGDQGTVKDNQSKEDTKTLNKTEKVSTAAETSKKETKKRIQNMTTEMDENITKLIEDKCETFKINEEASKIAEELYTMLEKNFPKGWCVFVGSHFYGLCVHEEKFCMEFEIDDFRVGIFKTYVPSGKS